MFDIPYIPVESLSMQERVRLVERVLGLAGLPRQAADSSAAENRTADSRTADRRAASLAPSADASTAPAATPTRPTHRN
jgi:hypothetical protein